MKHPLKTLRFQLRCTQWALGLFSGACLCAATPGFRQLLLDATNKPTADVSLSSSHWTGTLDAARLPTDALFNPAMPGAIGGTTPGAATFTNLNSTVGQITYFTASGYAQVFGQLDILYSYGHGTHFLPLAGDAGVSLTSLSGADANVALGNLVASGYLSADNGAIYTNGVGGLTFAGPLLFSGGGSLETNAGVAIAAQGSGGSITMTDNGGSLDTSGGGGSIDTSGGGGMVSTADGGGSIRTNGSGSPEGVVTAPMGSLYCNQSGTAGHILYVKESGTGNTGWVAK